MKKESNKGLNKQKSLSHDSNSQEEEHGLKVKVAKSGIQPSVTVTAYCEGKPPVSKECPGPGYFIDCTANPPTITCD